ncbi:MAG: response regulator [Chloroflexi bacterium]|nr:response regulator [Chloroflexota bacterium]
MEVSRVLVADNSLFLRTMIKSQLEKLNFRVVATAKDSQECLSKSAESRPDITLIDIGIAEENDFSVLRAILEKMPSSNVIVMLPDHPGFPEMVVNAVRAGASGFLKKPISPTDLCQRVLNYTPKP